MYSRKSHLIQVTFYFLILRFLLNFSSKNSCFSIFSPSYDYFSIFSLWISLYNKSLFMEHGSRPQKKFFSSPFYRLPQKTVESRVRIWAIYSSHIVAVNLLTICKLPPQTFLDTGSVRERFQLLSPVNIPVFFYANNNKFSLLHARFLSSAKVGRFTGGGRYVSLFV